MLFNSYIFILLFLPVTLAVYFAFHYTGYHGGAKVFLFAASLCFYGYYNPGYLLILCFSILVNYTISRLILQQTEDRWKKAVMWLGIAANLLVLFYFKYYDFFIENVNAAFGKSFTLRHIILPLGISFFTFQQISYVVDAFRYGDRGYRFLDYCVFVSFFPQLVAGPIVLARDMIPQFQDAGNHRPDWENLSRGFYCFAIGLFKKVVIADTFGRAVAWGWGSETIGSLEAAIVMLSYTFQLYFDFSGYCDMASGIASMFNIRLPLNFRAPYTSCSIMEFWDRWHMSLTGFLREYVYFPLGGSRKGKARTCVNILIVYLLSGIWHGANWTFILWGILHGLASVLNRIFQRYWDRCHRAFRWLATFLFVNFTWLIFRADSITQAVRMSGRILRMDGFFVSDGLKYCFALIENDAVRANLCGWMMLLFFAAAFYLIWRVKPCLVDEFRPTWRSGCLGVLLFLWAVCSLSSVSTFLYFGF